MSDFATVLAAAEAARRTTGSTPTDADLTLRAARAAYPEHPAVVALRDVPPRDRLAHLEAALVRDERETRETLGGTLPLLEPGAHVPDMEAWRTALLRHARTLGALAAFDDAQRAHHLPVAVEVELCGGAMTVRTRVGGQPIGEQHVAVPKASLPIWEAQLVCLDVGSAVRAAISAAIEHARSDAAR